MEGFEKKIVIFSGAGMSAESGISTFRDSNGLWENYNIEEVATPQAWEKDPELVTQFYNERRKNIIACTPNSAHLAIAEIEKQIEITIVTQNIDNLHERAGSKNVLHLHGNIMLSKSSGPNAEKAYYNIDNGELTAQDKCPEGYRLRPHVVWFGEEVPELINAAKIIKQADILIVIGTSLQVYPAGNLIHETKEGCKRYIIDPKAESMHIPNDFIKVNLPASEGILSVFEDIKKVLT